MNTITVHFARTGAYQNVTTNNVQAALKATGRPDACLLEALPDGAIDVTFDPDYPTIATVRARQDADVKRVAFALVCASLDAEQVGGVA